MANVKKKLVSGATLEIQTADFNDAFSLVQEVKKTGLELEDLFGIVMSENVQKPLWACMARCVYENRPVNRDLFEDEKIREDFLEVSFKVLLHNLDPFFKGLASQFYGKAGTKDGGSQGPK